MAVRDSAGKWTALYHRRRIYTEKAKVIAAAWEQTLFQFRHAKNYFHQDDLKNRMNYSYHPSAIHPFLRIIVVSVVEPEPDFFAEARAGKKAPAPGCCCVA